MRPVSGYVLAGGRSSRMQPANAASGQGSATASSDKALLEIGGRTLLNIALEKLQAICADVAILCGPADRAATLSRFGRTVADRVPGCGPMSGLDAALEDTRHDWLLLLQVDVPFLPSAALEQLCADALPGAPGVWCMEALGIIQPLPVCVHRNALHSLRRALHAGEHRLRPSLRAAAEELGGRVQSIGVPAQLEERWFHNVNTPEEFVVARQWCDAE